MPIIMGVFYKHKMKTILDTALLKLERISAFIEDVRDQLIRSSRQKSSLLRSLPKKKK